MVLREVPDEVLLGFILEVFPLVYSHDCYSCLCCMRIVLTANDQPNLFVPRMRKLEDSVPKPGSGALSGHPFVGGMRCSDAVLLL